MRVVFESKPDEQAFAISFAGPATGYWRWVSKPDTRDAIVVVKDEHESIQTLFRRVSGVDEDRRAVLKLLIQTLALHLSAEKQFIVPAVKDHVEESEETIDELANYHAQADRLLLLIERRKANSPDVPDMVTELHGLTDQHVSHVETTVVPLLRSSMSSDELDELGARMLSDERHLLTHAHPHLPDSGPLARPSKAVSSFVDSRRDHATDIGRAAT